MNCELMLTYDTPAYMFNVYKNQPSRQTGSRNLMGLKTLTTIWGTYMKLVIKQDVARYVVLRIPPPLVHLCQIWFILKQQWTIQEISIFSNSSHLKWRAGLSDTLLEGTHPETIPARFGLIWFSFRGEDLNVIFYQIA